MPPIIINSEVPASGTGCSYCKPPPPEQEIAELQAQREAVEQRLMALSRQD